MKSIFTLLALTVGIACAQVPPPHTAFDKDQVHEIRLRFPNADWYQVLTKNYSGTEADNPYFTASLEWGQYKFDSVGVRFKGNSSYSGSRTTKKPFRLKLNEFVKGQKIEGIGAFNLSNGLGDPSFVREKVYYEMATAIGLKAPRSNFASLYINDQYWGLYVLGEVVNSDFLKNYLGKGEDAGNLYKGNIGASFDYIGEDKAKYKEVWEKQTNEEADDWADLIALCKLINDTPVAQLRAKLEPIMDVDSVLTAFALDNATVNLDSYVGMGQNFNVYKRPSDNRWVWIVWDPSLAFGGLGQGQTTAQMQQLILEWVNTGVGGGGGAIPGGGMPPGGGVPPGGGLPPGGGNPGGAGGSPTLATRPLATKLWQVPEYKERYRQIYQQLVNKSYVPGTVVARMNTLRTMIRPAVTAEPDAQRLVTLAAFESAMTTDGTATAGGGAPGAPGGGGGGFGSAPGLQPFIDARVASIKTQLAATSTPNFTMSVNTSSLGFTQQSAGTAAASQSLAIFVGGTATGANYSISAATASGGTWLTSNIAGGLAPGSVKVTANGSALTAGTYTGSINIFVSGAINSPVMIPVTLTVTPAAAVPVPIISAIVNSASYAAGAIAPGEIVTIFGTIMGPATLASGTFSNSKLSTTVGGVQVTFDGVAAPLVYASSGQVSAIVPFEVNSSQSTVKIIYNGQTSAGTVQTVAATAPGIFTTASSGTGQGAIVNNLSGTNSASNAAAKGASVSIYLTGGGQTNPAGTSGAVGQSGTLQNISAPVVVAIGGQAATVTYSGAVPGSVQGLYQVNATIPQGSATGIVPVVVSIGGKSAQNGVTMWVK